MNRIWTKEEDNTIRQDRANGIHTPITAAKIGRKVPATYNRAIKIGATAQIHLPWPDEDEDRLKKAMKAVPPPTDGELSIAFNRPIGSIRWKLDDLKLIGIRHHIGRPVTTPRRISPEVAKQRAIRATEKLQIKTERNQRKAARLLKREITAAEKTVKAEARLKARQDRTTALAAQKLASDAKHIQAAASRAQKATAPNPLKARKAVIKMPAKTLLRPAPTPPRAERPQPHRPIAPSGGKLLRGEDKLPPASQDRLALIRAAAQRISFRATPSSDPDEAEDRLMSMMLRS